MMLAARPDNPSFSCHIRVYERPLFLCYDVAMLSFSPVSFYVREIPIYGDLILSPMDGYSDLPFRLICRELGSAMSYTEFVNVDELQGKKPNRIALKNWNTLQASGP